VLTDHRPLLGIFNKCLSEISNPRLLRFREKLANFSFQLQWIPGKLHAIADALSRAPVQPVDFQCGEISEEDRDVNIVQFVTQEQILSHDPSLTSLIASATADFEYQGVISALQTGKTARSFDPVHPARLYSNVWGQLSVSQQGLILLDHIRIVIPRAERQNILSLLHKGHGGIVKTRKLASSLYYWPGMNSAIKNMIDCCQPCQELRPSQAPEPLISRSVESPMESVSMDLGFNSGQD
jgi:hypothetical protein